MLFNYNVQYEGLIEKEASRVKYVWALVSELFMYLPDHCPTWMKAHSCINVAIELNTQPLKTTVNDAGPAAPFLMFSIHLYIICPFIWILRGSTLDLFSPHPPPTFFLDLSEKDPSLLVRFEFLSFLHLSSVRNSGLLLGDEIIDRMLFTGDQTFDKF